MSGNLWLNDRHRFDALARCERDAERIMEAEAVVKILPCIIIAGAQQLNFGEVEDDIAEVVGGEDVPCSEDIDGHAAILSQQELLHAVEQLQSADMAVAGGFSFSHDCFGDQINGLADEKIGFDGVSGVFLQDLCQQGLF